MKYCTYCGNKIDEKSKFCPRCGKNLIHKKEVTVVKEGVKEEKKEKLLLTIGTIFVIVASIIFALTNWNELTSIFRILFLAIESLLFLSLALFSKKVNFRTPYKFLWFIGISFVPLILHIIGLDGLLGDYLSYDGSGMYVFLAICFFIISFVYFISFKVIKSNVFLYITYFFTYNFFIVIPGIFKIDSFEYMIPIINGFNLLLCTLYLIVKNENYKKTFNIFISIVLLFTSLLTIIYSYDGYNFIYQLITYLTIIASMIILIFKSNKNIVIYLYPFIIFLVTAHANGALLNNVNLLTFTTILCIILINFIINQKDNRVLKNMSFIFAILFIIVMLIANNLGNLGLCLISSLVLALLIFISTLKDEKVQVVISKLLMPIFILTIIFNLIRNFTYIDTAIIYIITSIILFTISIILKYKSKDTLIKNIFEIYSIIYLIFSSFIILFTEVNILAFVLNEAAWIYYFIFNRVINKNKGIYISLLVGLLINFFFLSIKYSISIYYALLFIGIITAILDFVELKLKNVAIYIFFSIVAISLAIISDIEVNLFGIGLCVLAYISSYLLLTKFHKIHFVIKFLYTLCGFILISNVYNYFLTDIQIISILTLITYLVILISMFLLRVDSDRKVLGYSFIILFPYLELIDSVYPLYVYDTALVTTLLILLILLYFEKVFKLSKKNREVFELVLLVIIHLATIEEMLIFNFILFTFYIFFGFYKKRDSFIVFGTIFLVLNLIFNIFKIANSMPATYVLLIIGVVMLGYVFYMEAKKKNKIKNK